MTNPLDADFPEELLTFIQDCIQTVEAAELLIFLSRHPDRQWEPEEISHEIRPTVMTTSTVRKCLILFNSRGLVTQTGNGRFQCNSGSPKQETLIQELQKAYKERPVTLIRMIYSLKENKIRSFADAFKIKKD